LVYTYQGFQVKHRLVVLKQDFTIKTFNGPNGQTFLSANVNVIVWEGVVVLEKGLEIKLPPPLSGKIIKQLEIIPKPHFSLTFFKKTLD
jgi:hypothetical protein